MKYGVQTRGVSEEFSFNLTLFFYSPLFFVTFSSEKGSYQKLHLMETNGFNAKPPDFKPISRFRRILPQVLASAAQNLLILDLAMAMNFPTIAIPPLRGIRNREADEVITFTETHASWFGTLLIL